MGFIDNFEFSALKIFYLASTWVEIRTHRKSDAENLTKMQTSEILQFDETHTITKSQ
jgi:hypothetical protein